MSSNESQTKPKEFISWKEIAAHLGVDERTCRRWEEELGLPIRRIGSSSHARVFARREELDEWRKRISNNLRSEKDHLRDPILSKNEEGKRIRGAPNRHILILAPLVILALVSIFIFSFALVGNNPADFHIEKSRLSILNIKGRDLGRFNTGLENLGDDIFYRDHFQTKKETENPAFIRNMPLLIIEDLDDDGSPEILFAPWTSDGLHVGNIYCLDKTGKIKWEVKTGRELKFGRNTYSKDFVPSGIGVCDLNDDGFKEVVFITHSQKQFPTKISLISAKGEELSEYWNAGQINDYGFADLNNDGITEIILGGQNNSYEQPCLIVLDPRTMKGLSPHSEDHRCLDLEKGTEKYYVRIPLPPVDKLFCPGIAISKIDILRDILIQGLTTCSGLTYTFDKDLNLIDISLSHFFINQYNEGYRENKLRVPFDSNRILDDLESRVLYHEGTADAWTKTPAMSNRW